MLEIIIPTPIMAVPIPIIILVKFSNVGSCKNFIKLWIASIIPASAIPTPIPWIAVNPKLIATNPPAIPKRPAITKSLLSAIHFTHSGTSPCHCDKSILGKLIAPAPAPPPEFELVSFNTFISSKPAICLFNSLALFTEFPNALLFFSNDFELAFANKLTPNQAWAI